MGPHGHYCAPILHGDRLLGVLALYVPPEVNEDAGQLELAGAVANVLASIIVYRRAEEERLAHERIAQTRERLARIGELASGVANLVRNPLQGVLGCMDVLEANLPGAAMAEVDQPLALMREGLLRIGKVTERLLTLARNAPCNPRRTDIEAALDDVRGLLGEAAASRNVTLALAVPSPCHAEVDPDGFIEAAANVVANAIDASARGGAVSIRARTAPSVEDGLLVEVVDEGAGIPADLRARVFEPFFSTKPVGKGSGLGLSITRRILEEHGGQVELDSEPGRGTTVRLRFPRRG
jgi:signal transduction histidine kinase